MNSMNTSLSGNASSDMSNSKDSIGTSKLPADDKDKSLDKDKSTNKPNINTSDGPPVVGIYKNKEKGATESKEPRDEKHEDVKGKDYSSSAKSTTSEKSRNAAKFDASKDKGPPPIVDTNPVPKPTKADEKAQKEYSTAMKPVYEADEKAIKDQEKDLKKREEKEKKAEEKLHKKDKHKDKSGKGESGEKEHMSAADVVKHPLQAASHLVDKITHRHKDEDKKHGDEHANPPVAQKATEPTNNDSGFEKHRFEQLPPKEGSKAANKPVDERRSKENDEDRAKGAVHAPEMTAKHGDTEEAQKQEAPVKSDETGEERRNEKTKDKIPPADGLSPKRPNEDADTSKQAAAQGKVPGEKTYKKSEDESESDKEDKQRMNIEIQKLDDRHDLPYKKEDASTPREGHVQVTCVSVERSNGNNQNQNLEQQRTESRNFAQEGSNANERQRDSQQAAIGQEVFDFNDQERQQTSDAAPLLRDQRTFARELSSEDLESCLALGTNFSPAQILKLYRRFCELDTDGDGEITEQEFQSYPDIKANPHLTNVKQALSGNGKVDFPEFVRALSAIAQGLLQKPAGGMSSAQGSTQAQQEIKIVEKSPTIKDSSSDAFKSRSQDSNQTSDIARANGFRQDNRQDLPFKKDARSNVQDEATNTNIQNQNQQQQNLNSDSRTGIAQKQRAQGNAPRELSNEEVESLRVGTVFSPEQILKLYRRFCELDTDRDGEITEKEFQTYPDIKANPHLTNVKQVLSGNGKVDFPEFVRALSAIAQGLLEKPAEGTSPAMGSSPSRNIQLHDRSPQLKNQSNDFKGNERQPKEASARYEATQARTQTA